MPKISFAGFKDPGTRARWIIWLGAAVIGLAAVVIVAMGVTSTYWFCAEGCHKVQDDTIIAYGHSPHNKISCMACHMPVKANPIIFVLHKAEALGELYMTVTNNFELPLNPYSEVAMEMKTTQCTQCHSLETRPVTPSDGIKIDHSAHEEKEVNCTVCHNRTAHVEDFELTLSNPNGGPPNEKHDQWMTMTACFRCHTLEKASEEDSPTVEKPITAPGACISCHPKDFDLVPAFHKEPGFYPKGHAELAAEEASKVIEGTIEREEFVAEIEEGNPEAMEEVGFKIPFEGQINECYTCHMKAFCTNCHGMEMPHPEEFKEPKDKKDPNGHPVISKKLPKKCVMCHGVNDKTHFCDDCHHGTAIGWEYKAKSPWLKQHPQAVAETGLKPCFEKCHDKKFCSDCHTKSKVVPASHRARFWTQPRFKTVTVYGKKPAEPSALHSLAAEKSIESCEICHGSGGPNAAFCKACHKLAMPHPDEFKKFHAKTGRKDPNQCRTCHQWAEVCSNCHHIGSSFKTPWIQVHGKSAVKNGPEGCVEKCHTKQDCVKCHTSRNVVPATHKAKNFTRNPSDNLALHAQLYEKDSQICSYCHGEGGPNAKFCKSCHKLEMPHPIEDGNKQKFPHKEGFEKKQYTKAQCVNCHNQQFCDSCHHVGSSKKTPWLRYHPTVVKKDGAEPCFECHKEVFCSNCHVNLAKRGLLN